MKYVADHPFKASLRSLAVLVFLKNLGIASCFLEMKVSLTGDDAILVYEYFERTRINGFWTALICQNGELFRTNINVKAFRG